MAKHSNRHFLFKFLALFLCLFLWNIGFSQTTGQARESSYLVQDTLLEKAISLENVPYVFGGNSVETGLDCSSYIRDVFKAVGLELPRTAKEQSLDKHFEIVPKSQVQSGDLIFFKNTYKPGISHVGIMLDNTHMIHASEQNGVITVAKLIKGGDLSRKIAFVKRLKPSVEQQIAENI